MGSKIIGLAGILASTAFVYYCIDLKKQEIAEACQVDQKQVKAEATINKEKNSKINTSLIASVQEHKDKEIEANTTETMTKEVSTVKIEKSDPAFGVMFGDQINIVGMFAPESKNKVLIHFINELCKVKTCSNDIRFSNDIKEVSWQKDMVALIQMFNEEHIEKGSLYINSNVLHIEGKIESEAQKKQLEKLISRLKADNVFIEDETVNMITKVNSIESETDKLDSFNSSGEKNISEISADNKAVKKEQQKTVKFENNVKGTPVLNEGITEESAHQSNDTKLDVQSYETLDRILESNPIKFDSRVKVLNEESRKVLDKIAEILKNNSVKNIQIFGYANESDNAILNMVVSQKKADIVKNYLHQKGVHHIISKGMGAQKKSIEIEINVKKQ